jgi:CheY-like chemotaxis protein
MAKTARILIADDDKGDMEIMKIVLEELGMKEETAAVRDGVEVMDYLHRCGAYVGRLPGNPDLIFLDLKMPRINGLETLRQIRGAEEFKDIRVVIFSSSLDEKDRQESLARGADEFAVKPIDFEEFQRLMERLVNTYVTR